MKKFYFLTILLITGCTENMPKITVSEFLANEPLLLEYQKKCSDDIGGIGQHPTCLNAFEAYRKYEIEKALEKLTP